MDGIIILVVVVLVLFGSTQIPKLARSLGSAQKEFKKGLDEGSADDPGTGNSAAKPPLRPRSPRSAGRPSSPPAPPAFRPTPTGPRHRPPDATATNTAAGSMNEGTGSAAVHLVVSRQRWLPFWVLQVTELVMAVALAYFSVRVSHGGVLVVAAGVFALLALTARGPLGILRICGPRLHVTLTIVCSVLLALAPVVPAFRPDIQGIIVLEFVMVGVIRLATFTRLVAPVGPGAGAGAGAGAGRRARTMVIDASVVVAEAGSPGSPGSERPIPTTARSAGDPVPAEGAPRPSPAPGAAARWLGRTTGTMAASGKRAVAQHRPEVEAHAKRTIRSAGRVAGRLTAPSKPEPPPD